MVYLHVYNESSKRFIDSNTGKFVKNRYELDTQRLDTYASGLYPFGAWVAILKNTEFAFAEGRPILKTYEECHIIHIISNGTPANERAHPIPCDIYVISAMDYPIRMGQVYVHLSGDGFYGLRKQIDTGIFEDYDPIPHFDPKPIIYRPIEYVAPDLKTQITNACAAFVKAYEDWKRTISIKFR